MTYLRDETEERLTTGKALQRVWAAVIATSAVDIVDRVDVTIPGTDGGLLRWEDIRWQPRNNHQLPARGDECVVVMDDNGEFWVSAWRPQILDPNLIVYGDIHAKRLGITTDGYGALAIYTSRSGDANARFIIDSDGVHSWGSGSGAADTNLYREAAGVLRTDGEFRATGRFRSGTAGTGGIWVDSVNQFMGSVTATVMGFYQAGVGWGLTMDNAGNVSILGSTTISGNATVSGAFSTSGDLVARTGNANRVGIGAGNNQQPGGPNAPAIIFGSALDTNLYRLSPNFLVTDDAFCVNYNTVGQLYFNAAGQIVWDNAQDVKLYRAAAGVLKTDGRLEVGNSLYVTGGGILAGTLYFSGATTAIDSNTPYFYKPAANLQLITNASLVMSGGIYMDQNTTGMRIYFGGAQDTSLYRSAAGVLKTDGQLQVGNSLVTTGSDVFARLGSVTQVKIGDDGVGRAGVVFGNAGDTNLYRVSAGVLKTDGAFQISGAFTASTLASSGAVTIGGDTSFTRKAAGVIGTDNLFHIGAGSWLAVNNGNSGPQIEFGYYGSYRSYRHSIQTTAHGGIANGNTMDFFLWTPAVALDQLGTVRALRLNGDGTMYIGNADDTNLYRSAADTLKTDDSFIAAGGIATLSHMYLQHDSTPAIYFGASNDVNLYRYSSSVLMTDDSFASGGVLYLGTSGGLNVVLKRDTTFGNRLQADCCFTSQGVTCQAGQGGSALGNKFTIYWDGAAHLYIDATYIGNFAFTSDERYKHMIAPLKSSWETVKALNPVNFRWRDKGVFADDGKTHAGFLAQELMESIPTGASTIRLENGEFDPDQPLALNMTDIVATITKALQEAMARIEKLEAAT